VESVAVSRLSIPDQFLRKFLVPKFSFFSERIGEK